MSDEIIKTPPAQHWAEFRQRRLPLVVWSLAALICLFMLTDRSGRFEYIGLARALQYEISAETTGRLATVEVDLYDEVGAGEVVARLDASGLEAEIETVQAMIRKLGADLGATRAEMDVDRNHSRADRTADLRRFQVDEEQRRLDILELRATIESDEIELERLALDLLRAEPLRESGLIGDMEFDDKRLSHGRTEKLLAENRVLLEQIRQEYEAAHGRRQAFERDLPGPPDDEPRLRPLREAIAVETTRLREIQIEREALVLRSPVHGRVDQILCRNGQTVVRGEPILRIVERSVADIVAYLREDGGGSSMVERTPVLLASRRDPGRAAESLVVRVSPGVEMLPERLWRSPGQPDYGRAVIIAAVPDLDLAPGELVDIRVLD